MKCLVTLGIAQLGNLVDANIPKDPAATSKTLVLVSSAMGESAYYVRLRRNVEGDPFPARTRILATSAVEVIATRLDPVTLRVRNPVGYFATQMQRMYLDPEQPLRRGDVVQLSNMSATVTEITEDGRPQVVDFRFSTPLESPEWIWMRGDGLRLVPWIPPRVGESVGARHLWLALARLGHRPDHPRLARPAEVKLDAIRSAETTPTLGVARDPE